MSRDRLVRAVCLVLGSGGGAFLPAQAGCAADWTPGLIPRESPRGLSYAMVVFDDGTGPAGVDAAVASGQPEAAVARWDRAGWTAVGTLPPGYRSVSALAVFDDGGGQSLWIAGAFSISGPQIVAGFARWTGSAWTGFGVSDAPIRLNSFAVFDDGSGRALHAIGASPASTTAPDRRSNAK